MASIKTQNIGNSLERSNGLIMQRIQYATSLDFPLSEFYNKILHLMN